MRPAKFKNEALGFDSFDGYTIDEVWNGWDCPLFTFNQAQIVLETYNNLKMIIGDKNKGYYSKDHDAFIFTLSSDNSENEIFEVVEIEGQRFYPVGSHSWIWEEVEK